MALNSNMMAYTDQWLLYRQLVIYFQTCSVVLYGVLFKLLLMVKDAPKVCQIHPYCKVYLINYSQLIHFSR